MLQQGNLRPGDTPSFLARYGRDIAGAVQIWDPGDETEPQTPSYKQLSHSEIRALLEDPIGSPLANAPATGKSSLGGIQPKVVLATVEGKWAQAQGGFPTTHILKPQLSGHAASVIFDEEYRSRLARALGLADFSTEIISFEDLSTLVIERYDRDSTGRIHQEDFNQVLGASGNEKYQEVGGVVSLMRVADVLTRHTPSADLRRLAQMVVFAVATGNLDLHTKNLGILHPQDSDVRLAPVYDTVPQAHMPNNRRLALAVNKKYVFDEVRASDLEAEFGSWGLRRPKRVIAETLDQLEAAVALEVPLEGSFPELQAQIQSFIARLRTAE